MIYLEDDGMKMTHSYSRISIAYVYIIPSCGKIWDLFPEKLRIYFNEPWRVKINRNFEGNKSLIFPHGDIKYLSPQNGYFLPFLSFYQLSSIQVRVHVQHIRLDRIKFV